MALSSSNLTRLHRRQQLALRDVTVAEVARLWPALDWANLDATYPALAAAIAQRVAMYRRTSAGLAAAYLRAHRVASGLDGTVQVVTPEVLPTKQFSTSLRVVSLVAAKAAASRGVPADVAMGNALTQTSGAMARLVLNAGRETVTETVKADPRARGWQRVLGGGGCDYCRERAGVRMTSDEVFEAHDKCGCTSEPIYG